MDKHTCSIAIAWLAGCAACVEPEPSRSGLIEPPGEPHSAAATVTTAPLDPPYVVEAESAISTSGASIVGDPAASGGEAVALASGAQVAFAVVLPTRMPQLVVHARAIVTAASGASCSGVIPWLRYEGATRAVPISTSYAPLYFAHFIEMGPGSQTLLAGVWNPSEGCTVSMLVDELAFHRDDTRLEAEDLALATGDRTVIHDAAGSSGGAYASITGIATLDVGGLDLPSIDELAIRAWTTGTCARPASVTVTISTGSGAQTMAFTPAEFAASSAYTWQVARVIAPSDSIIGGTPSDGTLREVAVTAAVPPGCTLQLDALQLSGMRWALDADTTVAPAAAATFAWGFETGPTAIAQPFTAPYFEFAPTGRQHDLISTSRVSPTTSSAIVRQGVNALQISALAGDLGSDDDGTIRDEIVSNIADTDGYRGAEQYYAFSVRFPGNMPTQTAADPSATDVTFTQFKKDTGCDGQSGAPIDFAVVNPRSGPSYLELHVEAGYPVQWSPQATCSLYTLQSLINRTQRHFYLAPYQADSWYDIVLHVKWSPEPGTGFVQIWVNGEEAVPLTHLATLYWGSDGTYLRQGVYYAEATTSAGTLDSFPFSVIVDAARRAASYGDAALDPAGLARFGVMRYRDYFPEQYDSGTLLSGVEGGTWTSAPHAITLSDRAYTLYGLANIALTQEAIDGDFAFDVEAAYENTSTNTHEGFALIYGWRDALDFDYVDYCETDTANDNGVFQVAGGAITKLADLASPLPLDSGTQHVRIERSGSALYILRNDVVQAIVPVTTSPLVVGVGTRQQNASFWDVAIMGPL